MNLQTFLEKLDSFSDVERQVYIPALLEQLTEVSVRTMMEFQAANGSVDRTEQDEEIRQCVTLESSELGEAIRRTFDLPPLTMETQVV